MTHDDAHQEDQTGCRPERAPSRRTMLLAGTSLLATAGLMAETPTAVAQAQQPASSGQKPNIIVITGDDIGIWNIGAYHRGMMAGRTPNLDRLASEGMLFTDYYAEASCTAGRAAFITGELPIRTGMTTVGQAGAPIGLPAQAVTIATVLKGMGYATGQFGKNHLGDKNEFLPTVHGFDEFFGYLYHLDAMEDPAHPGYPQELLGQVGPRNMIHSWATSVADPTDEPRWGVVGKQRIEDAGPLYPKRMETVDDEIRDLALGFIEKAKSDGKPFFVWLNPTRMHVTTHLSPKYQALRNSKNGWTIHEAGMAQLDDVVGAVMKKLADLGVDDNTIVVFNTDNVLRSDEGRLARQQVSVREHAPAVCLSSTSIQAAPADPEELSAIANTGSSRCTRHRGPHRPQHEMSIQAGDPSIIYRVVVLTPSRLC
jgi:arylsulfatase A-like enzyme